MALSSTLRYDTLGSRAINRAFNCTVLILFCTVCFSGCSSTDAPPKSIDAPNASNQGLTPPSAELFTAVDAQNNLHFAREQYLKMLGLIESNSKTESASACEHSDMLCYPRSEEHGKVYLEKQKMWTNGFFPGVLWQLVITEELAPSLSATEKNMLIERAETYTLHLQSESKRGVTHDLGFILNNSFGLGLEYAGLSDANEVLYRDTLATGRDTLATRFKDEKGLIRSWDWEPEILFYYLDDAGKRKGKKMPLANPWQYPVIVDNMMNLEFMLASDNPSHQAMAYSHAVKTFDNHYFYDVDDPNKERPIAYHVFDYGENKPGNWQGLGNVSAWARGQGWSFYGFVSVAEHAKKSTHTDAKRADFTAITKKMFGTVSHLMRDDPVPLWDFFADRDNAAEIAAATPEDTAQFSRILNVCDFLIEEDQLPYPGWSPILFDQDILAESTLTFMKNAKPVRGDTFLIGDKVTTCGTQSYDTEGRNIPRDTSAAALIAAGAYRLAQMTTETEEKQTYIAFADRIMAELTKNYRTDKGSRENYDLGFVLHSATGNLPNWSEIDTSIVYADYYFIEANRRKLELIRDQ